MDVVSVYNMLQVRVLPPLPLQLIIKRTILLTTISRCVCRRTGASSAAGSILNYALVVEWYTRRS